MTTILATVEAGAPGDVPERSTIDKNYTWDLSKMYKTDSEWNDHYKKVDAMVQELAGLEGTTGKSPEHLARVLTLSDQIDIQMEKLYAYAAMVHHQDMRLDEPQARQQRAQTLWVKYAEANSWLEPELKKIPDETMRSWLKRDDLKVYDHYFDNLIRLKKHILSQREEELLAMSAKATSAAGQAFRLLTNTELKLGKVKDSDGNEFEVSSPVFYQKIYSKDRNERRDVYLTFHQSYHDVKRSLAATLAGTAHRDWYHAKARGYKSCLEASLDAENLPVSVYHNLIKTVNEHLPLLHRYTALKKKLLKLDEIHPYDLYVNLVDVPEKHYTYEEARELVLDGIQPMGPEYVAIMKKAFNSRWMDVYENKGKQSGAYNMGTYLSPPYVLLNFKGTYNGVSTIAHELGHAMQSWFAKENQPPVYSGYPMFTAEVASTSAEIVFKRHLLNKTTDKMERAWMVEAMLDNIRNTVFRQTKFSEFDLAFHEMAEKGEPITAESLMKISRDIFQKYYGPELVIDSEADIECLRIPHYYRNFYVYRYATSYSAAAALAKRIFEKEPGAVDDFMKFLKTGNSMYAIDMLKVAGVDMTTPKPIADCMMLFEDLLNQLEELLAGEV